MSSASISRRAACTGSAPKPLMTRTPVTVSSTTVANWACSAWTASTAGWMRWEKRRAVQLTNGSGASATSARIGSVMNSTTVTAVMSAIFDIVNGIMTTKA